MKESDIILVDMDNVLADQVGGFLCKLESQFPHIPRPDRAMLTSFEFEEHFPEAYRADVRNIRLTEGFFRQLLPLEGALDGLRDLQERGFEVRILTAPTWEWKYCIPEKFAWVEEHLGREWCGRMILTRDKTLMRGRILIDDAPVVSGALVPVWEHVLFDQPYNRAIVDKRRVSWETLDLLEN